MRSLSQEIAARATAAKFGGETPNIRALARDLLAVVGALDDAQRDLLDMRQALDELATHWEMNGGDDATRAERLRLTISNAGW